MTDELKPVRCGCGGSPIIRNERGKAVYVQCVSCGTRSIETNRAEAITAWNRAMGERTAKAIEHDASITDTDGYKYHRSEYLCGACKKKVIGGDEYCSHCGSRLIWGEDDE